jgi:uncharacterized protein
MSGIATMSPAFEAKRPSVPWWHTALVLLVLFACSVVSAYQNGLEHINLPGLSVRLAGDLTVMVEEWLIVVFIWLALRRCGVSIGEIVSGRWQSFWEFLRDLGLGIGFFVVEMVLLILASWAFSLSASQADMSNMPRTGFEAAVWVVSSLSAGFCEELIFRGYLTRQFTRWTGSNAAAVLIQGLAFGLSHGYKGMSFMILVMTYGWLWGGLAHWRKSLRPGMLAHCLQDVTIGLVAFFASA